MTPYLQKKTLYEPLIGNRPSLVLGLIVVIPCYDEKDTLRSLLSLQKANLPSCDVEVIVVINDATTETATIKAQNKATYIQLQKWIGQQNDKRLKFHVLYKDDLPPKHAGVGLARKIGMDEAVWRFEKIGKPNGIIVCFDADTKCQKNYFEAIDTFFKANPKTQAVSIHFEHPLTGIEFEDAVYESILSYELHLRYFVAAQRWAGFPFAYQTIGSSMAVRSLAYQQQGGMNKRKAGEDFYFLQKFIELGKVAELRTTTVIPSPRISHRVPFGTGKAVGDLIEKKQALTTYAPASFVALKTFFALLPSLYTAKVDLRERIWDKIPPAVQGFIQKEPFFKKVEEIQHNTSNYEAFYQRFFRWFNAFQLMKYVHYTRDQHFPNVRLKESCTWLSEIYDLEELTEREMLVYLRQHSSDRNKSC